MTIFIGVEKTTGEISRRIETNIPDKTQVFTREGEMLVEHTTMVTRASHFWDGSTFVAYTDEQAKRKANPPSLMAKWSNATFSYAEVLDLAAIKARKWAQIKEARTQVEQGGFIVNNKKFDSNPKAQANLQATLQTMILTPGATTIEWTLADNTTVVLTRNQFLDVGRALGNHLSDAHARSRVLRKLIDTATTVAAVEAITW